MTIMMVLFFVGISFANNLTFAVNDSANDPIDILEYRIYSAIIVGDVVGDYELEGTTPDTETGLTVTFLDGSAYSLVARAVDHQGRESGNSAEFLVTWVDGNPIFPGGPNPPTGLRIQ